MSNETELLLDVLRDEEQSTLAALKEVQEKKRQVLLAQQEQIELEELLKKQEYLAILKASPTELKVMGLSYNKLRMAAAQHSALRLIYVHRDVRRLLATALPSENEENFCRLVSALAASLVETYTQYRGTVHELRESTDTKHYFTSSDTVSVAIAASGKAASAASELLDDLVTAWALSWGSATSYEDKE